MASTTEPSMSDILAELEELRKLVKETPDEPKKSGETHNPVQDIRKNTGETNLEKVKTDERKPSDMDSFRTEVSDLRKELKELRDENLILKTKAAVRQELDKPNSTIEREGLAGVEDDIRGAVETLLFGKVGTNA